MGKDFRKSTIGIIQARQVRQVVDALLASPSPLRAIKEATSRWNDPSATPFERYAGMVLRDAKSLDIASFPPNQPVQLIPPSEGKLAQLACPSALDSDQASALECVENALNRLLCIADALEDAPEIAQNEQQATTITFLGVSNRSSRPGYRSAQISLPPISPTEQASIGFFNEVDWRTLDHVASISRFVFQNTLLPNMRQTILGISAPDGSDWDVRTRMASLIERLELPLRSTCRFDCDTQAGSVSVHFTVPPESAFPHYTADQRLQGLTPLDARLFEARMAYALRLACLMGAACFGSGKHIETASVTAWDAPGGEALVSCVFDRYHFVRSALVAIDSGELADPSLRFNPSGIARFLDVQGLRFASSHHATVAPYDDDAMLQQRKDPHEDTRELPPDAVGVFHCKRVCDTDTVHYHGQHGAEIDEALADSSESYMAAIARLENVVVEIENSLTPPGDDATSRPLYCDHPLSRAMISLLDDHLSVADQAEAFLNNPESPTPLTATQPCYFRAPSALFHAHMGLSDLYERIGDFRGAEQQADRCIELAPSTARAHFRKADVLAQQGRFEEAANIILGALRFTASERDCSLLYYHLALILWNLGRTRDASAVYVYTAFLKGDYADKAVKTIAGLRKRADRSIVLFASPLAAAREMSRAGIPVAPSDAVRVLVAQATMSLCNAHAPKAAAPYAAALAHYLRDDKIIAATCRSIQFGTDW